jgi:hypothetical protein
MGKDREKKKERKREREKERERGWEMETDAGCLQSLQDCIPSSSSSACKHGHVKHAPIEMFKIEIFLGGNLRKLFFVRFHFCGPSYDSMKAFWSVLKFSRLSHVVSMERIP